jgi:3-hydroxyacyl-CoA dehydrogenase
MTRLAVVGAGSMGAQIAQQAALHGADVVIEAIVERLDAKLAVFAELDRLAPAPAVLFRTTGDERYRPSLQLRAKVEAGELGRKTGSGWYRYEKEG